MSSCVERPSLAFAAFDLLATLLIGALGCSSAAAQARALADLNRKLRALGARLESEQPHSVAPRPITGASFVDSAVAEAMVAQFMSAFARLDGDLDKIAELIEASAAQAERYAQATATNSRDWMLLVIAFTLSLPHDLDHMLDAIADPLRLTAERLKRIAAGHVPSDIATPPREARERARAERRAAGRPWWAPSATVEAMTCDADEVARGDESSPDS